MNKIKRIQSFVSTHSTAIAIGAAFGGGALSVFAYYHKLTLLEITAAQVAHLRESGGSALYETTFGDLLLAPIPYQ